MFLEAKKNLKVSIPGVNVSTKKKNSEGISRTSQYPVNNQNKKGNIDIDYQDHQLTIEQKRPKVISVENYIKRSHTNDTKKNEMMNQITS
jgi:hypothetical protein